ncbi:sulfotransferase [Spirosoma sp.]|uniref:sulfotransferase n=1 Tax=Spirosoma sp. TaxID=1899569 RepID=UPI002614E9E2|nr:sulfotransferase [Spirosoma sp.]MCX6213088.1 sulfotransferase [Spirosoma sp.]
MQPKRVLFILGMHRSGTSLLASWLQECGLFIGENLLPAAIGNKKGHFEDVRFLNLHQRVLGELRSIRRWYQPTVDFTQVARQLIQDNNRRHNQWSWKDPRTCLLLPAWESLLPDAKAIIIFRHYAQVTDSLIRRLQEINRTRKNKIIAAWNRWTRRYESAAFADECLLHWITYNEHILDYVAGKATGDYVVVEVSSLIRHDRPIYQRLVADMGFALTFRPLNGIFDGQMIRTDVENKLPCSPHLLRKADAIYQQLQALELATLTGGANSRLRTLDV